MTDPIRIEAVKNRLTFEGIEYHETDGLGKICRLLVQRGVPLGEVAHIYRGETLSMVGCIHSRAKRSLREEDTGFKMKAYKEFTGVKT